MSEQVCVGSRWKKFRSGRGGRVCGVGVSHMFIDPTEGVFTGGRSSVSARLSGMDHTQRSASDFGNYI